MQIVGKCISTAVTMLMVAAVSALVAFAAVVAAGYKPQVVKSGSMRPMLERGSIVFVKPTPARQLRVGQVITFQNPIKGGKELVTHRIVSIEQVNGKSAYATKGDANASRDPWLAEIVDAGVLRLHVPYAGRVSFIVHDRNGYIALFVAPLLLLAGGVLWKIWTRPPAETPALDPVFAAAGVYPGVGGVG